MNRKHLATALRSLGLFAVSLTGVTLTLQQPRAHTFDHEQAVPYAQMLAEDHGCWSGEAPADMTGQIPGHVVVTAHGIDRYAGSRLVGKALEQTFDGVDHGLTVHAFCR